LKKKKLGGEELYGIYAEEMAKQGWLGIDSWDELDAPDREAWDAIASRVVK